MRLKPFPLVQQEGAFDLTLELVDSGVDLKGFLKYSTDLFDKQTIERMAGHFGVLVRGIVNDPDRCVCQIPILTQEERHQLLVNWNDTRVDYPKDVLLHELFEAQVERTPNAVAVCFEGREVSYRELNERANRLAHHLRRLGVAPDTLVGVCMERSLDLVVALYGVVKAGGAYVPIDPEYPQERVAFMLEDAGVPVLLTQSRLAESLRDRSSDGRMSRRGSRSDSEGGVRQSGCPDEAGQPRLHDLHLRIDRQTERCDEHPPGHLQPSALDAGSLLPHRDGHEYYRRRLSASMSRSGSSSGLCWQGHGWSWPRLAGTETRPIS